MRFFLDENFPFAAKNYLEKQGHEVLCALMRHPQGMIDSLLFEDAQNHRAIFVTTDKDFYHTIPFLYDKRTAAVVVIALKQPNRTKILARFNDLLSSIDLRSCQQSVFLVTDNKIYRRD